LFGETSHVVKSQRQRSIIERTRRPFSFDIKASITEDLDPPALLRRPRFCSKEGTVRHESVGAAQSSLLAFSSSQWRLGCFPLSLTQINARPAAAWRYWEMSERATAKSSGRNGRNYPLKLGPELGLARSGLT
jgi:hypothetical protein